MCLKNGHSDRYEGFLYHSQEIPVHSFVLGEFGVEGADEHFALLGADYVSV